MGIGNLLSAAAFHFFSLLTSSAESTDSAGGAASEIGEGAVQLAIQYGWYLIVIIAGLLLLAFVRKKSKKTLTPEAVRQNCAALKKRLEDMLSEERKSKNGIFNQAKMMKLCSSAEEAMWSASRLVDERKDLVFDGVAGNLDGVANLLSEASANTFAENAETAAHVREALEQVERIIVQIDEIISSRKRKEE